jgi:hypothetical protein
MPHMSTYADDLKLCFDALTDKQGERAKRWRYYDGDHPIAFQNEKIAEVIPNGVVFRKNWCQVVVNVTRDRLSVQSWSHTNDAIKTALEESWNDLLEKEAGQVHLAALVTGEAYLVAWPNQAGDIKAYYHDPRQAHVIYDDEDPDMPRVACKTWLANGGKNAMLNLYYPTGIVHYQAESKEPSSQTSYRIVGEEPNPYGIIPVFHFRLDKRVCVGELSIGVLSLQDALNKILNDMMVASEYAAFDQRWAIGEFMKSNKWEVGASKILVLPPGATGEQPTSVGSFPSINPEAFLRPMEDLRDALSLLSATPGHYFTTTGQIPSGEALQAAESPLIAKARRLQNAIDNPWMQVQMFCLRVKGVTAKQSEIDCIWKSPETTDPLLQAQVRQTNVAAGIPITNQLRDEGWTDEDLEQLRKDAAEDAATKPAAPPTSPALPRVLTPAAIQATKTTLGQQATTPVAEALSGLPSPSEKAVGSAMDKFAGKKVRI